MELFNTFISYASYVLLLYGGYHSLKLYRELKDSQPKNSKNKK